MVASLPAVPVRKKTRLVTSVRLGVNFKGRQYQTLDKPVRASEAQARSGMILTAYLGSLLTLRVRTQELAVSKADEMILDEILLSVTRSLWTQLSSGTAQATNLQREFSLSAIKGSHERRTRSVGGLPSSEEHLFGGQFATIFQRELGSRKQAA